MSIKISAFRSSGFCLSCFVVLAALFLSFGTASAADSIGIIDSQKVLFQHPNFGAVAKQVGAMAREKQAAIEAAAAQTSNGEEKMKIMQDGAREVKEAETRLMEPIDKDCMNAVQAVAKAKGMTVILEKDAAYYGGVEITEDVIAWLKKNVKAIEK